MDYRYKQLERELSALSKAYSELGARLSEVAKEVASPGMMPSEKILEQISASRTSFEASRASVHAHAGAMLVSPLPKLGDLASIAMIDALLKAAATAEEGKFSTEAEREKALAILHRALSIAHKESLEFKPLQECQAKLGELRSAIANVLWPHRHPDSESIVALKHPANALLLFVENLDTLDDEKWMAMETTITESYGKPLFVAASRGKLVVREAKGESQPAASKPVAAPAPPPPAVKTATPAPEPPKPPVAIEKPAEKPIEKPIEKKAVVDKAPEKPAIPAPAPAAAPVPVPVAAAPVATPASVEKKIAPPPAPVATPAPAPVPAVATEKKELAPEKAPAKPAPTSSAAAPAAALASADKKATAENSAPAMAPIPVSVSAPIAAAQVTATPSAQAPPALTAPAPPAPAPAAAIAVAPSVVAPVAAAAPVNTTSAPPTPVSAPASQPAPVATVATGSTHMAVPATTQNVTNSLAALATATDLPADKKPAVVEVAADKQRKEPRLAVSPSQPAAKLETKAPEMAADEAQNGVASGDASQRPQRWGFWRGNR